MTIKDVVDEGESEKSDSDFLSQKEICQHTESDLKPFHGDCKYMEKEV